MITNVSFDVRNHCRDLLLDTASGFNSQVADLAPMFGLEPFRIGLKGNPATLYLGRYQRATLEKIVGDNHGVFCVLSVAKSDAAGRSNTRFTPSQFSGVVPVVVDFYTVRRVGTNPPDGDALWFLLESAMIGTFNTLSPPQRPSGVTYNNEMIGEPGPLEWDGARLVQDFTFTMFWYRVAYGY